VENSKIVENNYSFYKLLVRGGTMIRFTCGFIGSIFDKCQIL